MTNSIDTYKIFADFYDLYVGKYDSDLDFYKSFCAKTDKIIEIGCGTGRILECFLKLDFNITGVDISQEMLDKASVKLNKWQISNKLKLINHDFTTARLSGKEKYDKALLSFYTFNYILDSPKGFLKNINTSLVDNGLLLIDLFYPNSLFDPSIDNKWIDKEFMVDGNKIQIKDNRHVIDNIEHRQQIFHISDRQIQIDTIRRYYCPDELKDYLEMAGFTNIQFALDYDLTGFNSAIDETRLKSNYVVKASK